MQLTVERIKQGQCWDCGQVPTDEGDRREVRLGFQCRTCFDRDTEELKAFCHVGWHLGHWPVTLPPEGR